MKREGDYFGERELVLIYIAKRLKHALKLESVLTGAGIDYAVEPDQYTGGVIFRSLRVGAFFYVLPEVSGKASRLLEDHGFKPYELME